MRKKIYILLIFLSILFLSSTTIQGLSGTGTKKDPYLISTCQELQGINQLSAHYQLTKDIDCAGISNFVPIGGANAFKGTLDGHFYTIHNLKISNKMTDRMGLFSKLEEGEIKNIRFQNANIAGNRKVGVLAAEAVGENIRGISVQGRVECSEECGGLVGTLYGEGATIEDSDFKGTITGANRFGGLVGKVQHYAKINHSYAKAMIELDDDLEGAPIIGTGQSVKSLNENIDSSLEMEPITGLDKTIESTKGDSIGGLVGELSEYAEVNNSYARSTVQGETRVGGLVGLNTTNAEIYFSFTMGSVNGKRGTGGLVGENNAKIIDSYAITTVKGVENAGGLVGTNESNGEIQRAFAKGDVEASNYVGGLVGTNRSFGLIKDTYAFGEAGGNTASYVGGLVGTNERSGRIETSYSKGISWAINYGGGLVGTNAIGGIVRNSYYDKDNALKSDTTKGTPKSTAQMKNKNELTGFDFTNVWNMDNSLNNGYPYLRSTGPGANYYAISTCQQLQNIKNDYYGYYELKNDIDCSATSSWDNGKGFAPIGYTNASNVRVAFKGILEGDGYTIRQLTINRQNSNDIGLIGVSEGIIKNIHFEQATVKGYHGVGILVGDSHGGRITHTSTKGTLVCTSHCGGLAGELEEGTVLYHGYSEAIVRGDDKVGGLVGHLYGSKIEYSHAAGNVSGYDHIGGLVGTNEVNSEIENSFATGDVSGSLRVGGLVGWQFSSSVETSFATGTITSVNDVGGLVGWNQSGVVKDSYATGNITGTGRWAGGLVGDNNADSLIENSYAIGNVEGNYEVGGLAGSNHKNAAIQGSYATGEVKGNEDVGGLTGSNLEYSKIQTSYATGNVTSINGAGGLVGWNQYSVVKDSYATGNVTVTTRWAGGLVGDNNADSLIENSYAIGKVIGNQVVGGLVGSNRENSTIQGSYATGEVKGGDYTGGLVGGNDEQSIVKDSHATGNTEGEYGTGGLTGSNNEESIIEGSYATGNVTSTGDDVGGLVGLNDNKAKVTKSHATGQVKGSRYVGGLIGRSHRNSTVNTSYAQGNVTGDGYVGGLIGMQSSKSIVFNSEAVNSVMWSKMLDWSIENYSGKYFGGLIGSNENSMIEGSFAMGNVEGDASIGGLVGSNLSDSIIQTSYAIGKVVGKENSGGLVGENQLAAVIRNSYAEGDVEGRTSTGGLVGLTSYESIIEQSYAKGNVKGQIGVGGLIGTSKEFAYIRESYATGNVEGNNEVGGFIGVSHNESEIQSSYATGYVIGVTDVGGFAGSIESETFVGNSYAIGNVRGNVNVGGMIGKLEDAYVENMYANGFVRGTTEKGGLVGRKMGAIDITNSYYDHQTTEQEDRSKGTPLSTNQMKTQSSFASWDFTSVWALQPGTNNGYPYLRILERFVPRPDVIKNLTTQATQNTIKFSWENPKGSNIDKVRIFRNDVLIYEGKVSEFVDTDLATKTTYHYEVYVVNANGDLSFKTPVSITTDGLLTIDASLERVNFGTILLDGTVQTKSANPGNFTIKDTRNNPVGYHVTVSATPFTNQAINKTMNGTSLYLKKPTSVETLSGNTPPTIQNENEWLLGSGGVKIVSSAANTGSGEYRVQFANDALKLLVDSNTLSVDPAHQKNTEYKATITWTVVSGP